MWRRVTKRAPCPACGHATWCAWTPDGERLKCERVAEAPQGMRRVVLKDGGALFAITGAFQAFVPAVARRATQHADMEALAREWTERLTTSGREQLAASLGVKATALLRLQAGSDGEAYTFPMRDANFRVVGIRRRMGDGRKLSARGGHEGCFAPTDFPEREPVYVVEGPTDAAAILSCGLEAIGRPSCSGGVEILCSLLAGLDVVIVADRDESDKACRQCGDSRRVGPLWCSACRPGQAGAVRLATALQSRVARLRLAMLPPGVKDSREWVRAGATDVQFRALAASAARIK